MIRTPDWTSLGLVSLLCAIAVCVGLQGCSMGKTQFKEDYYLGVPSGRNTNYFRITVTGDARLSETNFRSGSFPADIVDSLYGDTSKAGVADAYKLQGDVKKKVNEALLKAWTAYLEVASNPNAEPAKIEAHLAALRRIRSAPGDEIALPKGAVEMEYAPDQNLVLRGSGQKLVFVMSSDPDNVIQQITTVSQDVETSTSVLRLADLVQQRAIGDLVELEAKIEGRDTQNVVFAAEIDNLQKLSEGDTTQAELVAAIEALRSVLDIAR